MPIFIETDNPAGKFKIYDGAKAGTQAKAVEDRMQAIVQRLADPKKNKEFTTTKSEGAKGYVILLTLASVTGDSRNATCNFTISAVQYPREVNAKGEIGDVNVAWPKTSSAEAKGMKDPILACVDSWVEAMVTNALPVLSRHFATRR